MSTKPNHLIGFFLMLFMIFGANIARGLVEASQRSLAQRSSAESTSNPTATASASVPASPGAQPTPKPAANHALDEDTIRRQYQEADAAYSRLDGSGHIQYLAENWSGVDVDGNKESRETTAKYYAMRFSSSHPKRFTAANLETTIKNLTFTKSDEAVANIVTVVRVNVADGTSRGFKMEQRDTWMNRNGSWKCQKSRTTKRNQL